MCTVIIRGVAGSGSVMTGSGTALGGCHGTLLFNGQRGCYSEGEGSFPGTHSQHTVELGRSSAVGLCPLTAPGASALSSFSRAGGRPALTMSLWSRLHQWAVVPAVSLAARPGCRLCPSSGLSSDMGVRDAGLSRVVGVWTWGVGVENTSLFSSDRPGF